MIQYDDFAKLELAIGEIKNAEAIEKSDKLVKLIVEFGDQTRQIVAGIRKSYAPENLIGKKATFLINLEPREIFGVESQGMILAAHDKENNPVILIPERDVDSGSQIG